MIKFKFKSNKSVLNCAVIFGLLFVMLATCSAKARPCKQPCELTLLVANARKIQQRLIVDKANEPLAKTQTVSRGTLK